MISERGPSLGRIFMSFVHSIDRSLLFSGGGLTYQGAGVSAVETVEGDWGSGCGRGCRGCGSCVSPHRARGHRTGSAGCETTGEHDCRERRGGLRYREMPELTKQDIQTRKTFGSGSWMVRARHYHVIRADLTLTCQFSFSSLPTFVSSP